MSNHPRSHEESRLATHRIAVATVSLLLAALLLELQGCGSTPALPPPPSTYTTIDAPGAGTAIGLGTFVQDINGQGDIVGYFKETPFDMGHAFIRSPGGSLTVFDVPGQGTQNGQGAIVQRVNSGGTIVGYFSDQQSVIHGYIRAPDGAFTIFDAPGASATFTAGINDDGVVAGQFVDQNLATHGFFRTPNGTFTVFDPPSSNPSSATISVVGINASGVVIGFFFDFTYHGLLCNSTGTVIAVDVVGAGIEFATGTVLADLNTSGAIVGSADLNTGSHNFLRTPAGAYTLFDPPGASGSSTTGINDSGAIVGNYTDANRTTHGYLRNPDGTFTTIDDPNASQGANSPGTVVTHINSKGVIVGYYADALGARHGFARE